jgi:hypothetical protein
MAEPANEARQPSFPPRVAAPEQGQWRWQIAAMCQVIPEYD